MSEKSESGPMLTVAELREELSDRRLKVVADRIEMTYAALRRIALGGNPSRKTRLKIENYIRK